MDTFPLLECFGILDPDADLSLAQGFMDTIAEQQLLRGREEKDLRKFVSSVNVCLGNPRSRAMGMAVNLNSSHETIFCFTYIFT